MTDAASPSVQGFKDLASLRARHLQMLGCETTEENGSDKVSADAVQKFLQRAKASGAILSDTDDRDAAQRVIDYWSADLVAVERSYGALGEKKALDPCRPEPTVAASPGAETVAEETYKKSQAQQDIRVAIVARRWRDTKSDAYLLSGDALENASKFDRDPDTARLIMANVAAERKTKVRQSQMKNRLIARMGAVCSAERCDARAVSGAGGGPTLAGTGSPRRGQRKPLAATKCAMMPKAARTRRRRGCWRLISPCWAGKVSTRCGTRMCNPGRWISGSKTDERRAVEGWDFK